jgi:ribosome biogenesis GTPase
MASKHKPQTQPAFDAQLRGGLVVANHGRHLLVEDAEGSRILCHPRGKKNQAVVGDRVQWLASQDEGTIERIAPRHNLFYRQDDIRTKSFAANLDQVLILIAAEPEFSNHQLSRALIAAHEQGIRALIALNKKDLSAPFERAWIWLQPYRLMGYEMLGLSLAQPTPAQTAQLLAHLRGRTTLVLGPSGAGKSTLINTLIPDAQVQTGELSRSLNTGKHTTTSTTWYWTDPTRETALIDSPGFQEFGLHQIEPMQLAACMPDIAAHARDCKFYNCTHLHEPGCGVIAAVGEDGQADGISSKRYAIYAELFEELTQARRH